MKYKSSISVTVIYALIMMLLFRRQNILSFSIGIINYVILIGIIVYYQGEIFKPLFIISAFWLNALWLNCINVNWVNYVGHLNINLNYKFIVLYYVASLLFFMSFIVGYRSVNVRQISYHNNQDRMIYIYRSAVASFIIAISVFIITFVIRGGLPVLSEDVNIVRDEYYLPFIGVLSVMFHVAIACSFLYILLNNLDKLQLFIAAMISMICIFCILSTTQRVGIIESSMLTLGLLFPYYNSVHLSKTRIVLIFLVLLIMFSGFILIGIVRELNIISLTDFNTFIGEQIYVYLGGPAIKNLQYAYNSEFIVIREYLPYPLIFRSFYKPFIDSSGVDMGELFVGPNNGTAFLFWIYDFGLIGFIIPTIIVGLLTGFSYRQYNANKSLGYGLLFGVLFGCALFVPITDKYFDYATIVRIVVFFVFAIFMNFMKYVCRYRFAWRNNQNG